MAYLYIRASQIKASKGKSAVASAAYMSGQSLYNERIGMTFQYTHKEEVAYTEILLPVSADEALKDRGTLWNTVEALEKNRANARLARQFVIALPNEWDNDKAIRLCHDFLQTEIVDRGFALDWALHRKENNSHIHVMVTPRRIVDGQWQNNKKSVYVLDENGNKVPELNPDGTQKQRTRKRTMNGTEYVTTENIWKRKTIDYNEMTSRQFLREFKRSWVKLCNQHLSQESKIDNRSTHELPSNRVPLLHEGPAARAALEHGVVFDVTKENQERRQLNAALARMEQLIRDAQKLLSALKEKFKLWREAHDQRRSITATELIERYGRITSSVPGIDRRDDDGTGERKSIEELLKNAAALKKQSEIIRKHHRQK